LAFFLAMALWQSKGDYEADGWRYIQNARNLMHGYFASPDTLMFWNGPGYPIFLVPFLALKLPLKLIYAANAAFMYLGIVHFQGALRLSGVGKRSLAYAYAMGLLLFLHGPLMGMVMTESLSAYLACGAAYHYCRAARSGERLHVALAGFHLGYLALTKVFFGYALEASIPIAGAIWAWKRAWAASTAGGPATARMESKTVEASTAGMASTAGIAAAACAIGLLVCMPYLAHTWHKTGKANFWGNAGGMQLYFMSMPEKEYFGDWLNFVAVIEHPEYFPNHVDFIRETIKLDWVAQDSVFKQAALRQYREHPRKAIDNWRANVNRMAFGFPNTVYPGASADLSTGNRAFVYAFPFMLLLMLAIPGWLGRRSVPPGVHACLAFACLSLGGMSLVCAIPRQVFPMLPLLGLWCAVVLERTVRFQPGSDSHSGNEASGIGQAGK
jgi:hypothetical protein